MRDVDQPHGVAGRSNRGGRNEASKYTEEQFVRILKESEAGISGMKLSDVRRLKQLEEENRRLKTIVADLTLDNQALKAVVGNKLLKPKARRKAAEFVIGRNTLRSRPLVDRDEILRARMKELADRRRRFGCRRLHVLLRREALVINHKRTEREYKELWAMDFLSDALADGRR